MNTTSISSGATQAAVGLLLSGGLDSAILLRQLLGQGRNVQPFYVRTGCIWQVPEQHAVHTLLAAMRDQNLAKLVELDMPVDDLYRDHWSITGAEVPDETTSDEAVYLPGRNPLLLMKPALWCVAQGISELALATLASNPFDDASAEFFARFEAMLAQATGSRLQIVRPFETLSKRAVIALGRDMPLQYTFSCLSPVGDLHCGHCNKCAERMRAFALLDLADPTRYATGFTASSYI
jgi:7-cyano-7-deazaguanine synthase